MHKLRLWIGLVVLAGLLTACDKNSELGSDSQSPILGAAEGALALSERRVGIVYSESTAKNYYDEFVYGQLYTAMQHQSMQAGIPYDLLSEADLVNASALNSYSAVIIPAMSHVDSALKDQIANTLSTAQKNGVAIITSSEFMVYDQDNKAFSNPYAVMADVLGVEPSANKNAVAVQLKVSRNDHPITARYGANEVIDDYAETWFTEYSPLDPSQAITLAEGKVGNRTHAVLQVLERPSRVVHFASDSFLADNNLLWSAIRWAIYADTAPVSLLPSRAPSLFIARNDMDQAMIASELKDNEIPLLDIIKDWKRDYNFVGSYYIDIGDSPADGEYTDWTISGPLYADYLALDNEFGTHSWTHPHITSDLTDTELEFEFNQSRQEISTNLNINVIGGAVPGTSENLNVVENLNQWFEYFSGRAILGSVGFRSGFGFLQPDHKMRYFNLNMSPDYGLIDYLNYTPDQATEIWKNEIEDLLMGAEMPVMHWLWHDYGPTAQAATGRYSKSMFEDTIKQAYKAGSEFATAADYHSRLNSFETATLSTGINGNISAVVEGVGLGQFALKLDTAQKIASVANWYAYSDDAVFIPDNGGEFTIVPGNKSADFTHISELPMRARLTNVVGDGNEINFSFIGQGDVVIDLGSAMKKNYSVSGADSFVEANSKKIILNFSKSGSHTASVTAINAVNSVPVANSGSVATGYSKPVDLVLVATDPNNDALKYAVTVAPANGELTGAAPNFTYMPNDGFSGTDEFQFSANDGSLTSAAASITITVDSPDVANGAPVANKAVYSTIVGQNISVLLSGADNEGESLQFTIVTQPSNGTVTGTPPNVVYKPSNGFIGQDEFTYMVSDGKLDSSVEKVIVHVGAQALASNGTVSNSTNSGFTIDGKATDWVEFSPFSLDPQDIDLADGVDWKQVWMAHDNNSFYMLLEQYQAVNLDWRSQVYIDTDTQASTGFTGFSGEYPIGAEYIIEGNSIMKYAGSGNDWKWDLQGSIDSAKSRNKFIELEIPRAQLGSPKNMNLFFTSVNTDNSLDFYPDDATNDDAVLYTRQFSYSVKANNDPANAAPTANSMSINTVNNAELPIVINGYDLNNDSLTYAILSQPLSGTLTGSAPNLSYVPNNGAIGTDRFTFQVNDGTLTSNTATVTIEVVAAPVLDSIPVAHNQSIVVFVDQPKEITLSGSDYDGSSLSFKVRKNPENGTLSGQVPNLVYTPNANYKGTDSFTYRVNDGSSNSKVATVKLTVENELVTVNITPVAVNQSLVTAFGTAIGIKLTGTDKDADVLSYVIVSKPSAGKLTGTAPNLTYTPDANTTGIDSLTFRVNDGSENSAVATVSINVKAKVESNQAPSAIGQSLSTAASTPLKIELNGTDPEQDKLSYTITKKPSGGTLSGTGSKIVYTPTANFKGVDRFNFSVSDGALSSKAVIVTIDVAGNADTILINQQASITVDGDIADWVGLIPFKDDPDDVSGLKNPLNWRSLMMADDDTHLYFLIRNDGPFTLSWGHAIHLDVDGKTSTGFRGFAGEAPIGADYLIEGNNLHAYTGNGTNWSWEFVKTADSVVKDDILEMSFPKTMMGNPKSLSLFLRANNEPFGGKIIDYYPDAANDVTAPVEQRVLSYSAN